jgi:4-amino-4-deoxy-L-arabinose transferase-like glycosyltransferase
VEKFNIVLNTFAAQQTVLRVISMLFSVGSTILIAILNPIAGLFMAISSWNIKYSSEAMFDSGANFFVTLGLFCFIKSKKTEKSMDKLMIISAIAMGLAFGSKYITATTAITILPFLFIKTKSNIKNFFIYGLIAFGTFFISDPILWNNTASRLTHSILFHEAYSTGTYVRSAGFPFYQQLVWLVQPVPWNSEAFPIKFDTIILLLGLAGAINLFKKSKIIGCWFFINLIFLLIYPTKWAQYTLIFIPALCLSAGDCVLFLKSKIDLFIGVMSEE